ncbi:MAG: hypothetical protein WBF24_04905 [Xanthobacteraceae bacterium]
MADAATEPTVVLSSAVAGPGEQHFALVVIAASTPAEYSDHFAK